MSKKNIFKFLEPAVSTFLMIKPDGEELYFPVDADKIKDSRDIKDINRTDVLNGIAILLGAGEALRQRDEYTAFLKNNLKENFKDYFMLSAREFISREDEVSIKRAFCILRYINEVLPGDLDILLLYVELAKKIYLASDEYDEIGIFKAEAMIKAEEAIDIGPDEYFTNVLLATLYLNTGLYKKAELLFKNAKKSLNMLSEYGEGVNKEKLYVYEPALKTLLDHEVFEKTYADLLELIESAGDYAMYEAFQNDILTGRLDAAEQKMNELDEDKISKNWWYIFLRGLLYFNKGDLEAAEENFKAVLRLNASHIDSMEHLVSIYSARGDERLRDKYIAKIELINENSSL